MVRDDSGGEVTTTSEHPYFVEGKGWIKAGELAVDDKLETLEKSPSRIASITWTGKTETVYNFEVEDVHTYYVWQGEEWVVVHNNGCESADELLDAAREARDAKAAEVGRRKAAVTGGYGRDGVPRAGCSSNPVGCAEDDVARQIGGDPKDITFTEALRPRTGKEQPICWSCQGKYDQSQFPPGTKWKPGGPWDNNR